MEADRRRAEAAAMRAGQKPHKVCCTLCYQRGYQASQRMRCAHLALWTQGEPWNGSELEEVVREFLEATRALNSCDDDSQEHGLIERYEKAQRRFLQAASNDPVVVSDLLAIHINERDKKKETQT